MNYKYNIGDHVWQWVKSVDDYELGTITERSVINGHNCYCTDIVEIWTNEDFLKPKV